MANLHDLVFNPVQDLNMFVKFSEYSGSYTDSDIKNQEYYGSNVELGCSRIACSNAVNCDVQMSRGFLFNRCKSI